MRTTCTWVNAKQLLPQRSAAVAEVGLRFLALAFCFCSLSLSGRDFTDGSEPLAVLVKRWLVTLCANPRTSALLRSVPYSVTTSSSLFDLIQVANAHIDLALFIFQEFIGELKTQMR